MRWSVNRVEIPAEVRAAVPRLDRGEQWLAAAPTSAPGGWLAATTYRLFWVADGGWARPWTAVDSASWSRESANLTVSWAEGGRPTQWAMAEDGRFLTTLRERVQASVVLAGSLDLGDRRSGRVAIRRDQRTGELFDQVVLGRFSRFDDPEVAAAVARLRADLREQVGL